MLVIHNFLISIVEFVSLLDCRAYSRGFPSEEGGLGGAHLAPLLPVALESIFDTDPWKLTVRGFIKWVIRRIA